LLPHSMIMIIKASRINNLTDARYFAAREVHFLGFNLEEGTPGYLEPMVMNAIREWVEGPVIVGEFATKPLDYVREAAHFFNLPAVQINARTHGTALSDFDGVDILLEIPNDNASETLRILEATSGNVRHFILNGVGNIAPETWRSLASRFSILLNPEGDTDAAIASIHAIQPAGIVVEGGDEERVGVKSFEEIDVLLDAVEISGQ